MLVPWLAAALSVGAAEARVKSAEPVEAPLPALLARLESGDGEQRLAAANAITALGPEAIGSVFQYARARHVFFQEYAIETIADMGRPAARPLAQALYDPSEAVRLLAARALEELGQDAEPALPELVDVLGGRPAYVASAAAYALAAIGEPAVASIAATLGRPATRARAAAVLAKMGRRRDPAVERALGAFAPAAQALALFELGRAVPNLEWLGDDVPTGIPEDGAVAVGFYGRALALLDPAIDTASRDAHRTALEQLVAIHATAGEEALAASHAAHLIERYLAVDSALSAVAEFHLRFGRPHAAEELFRARHARGGDLSGVRLLAGLLAQPVWSGRSRRAEAVDLVEAFAAAHPEDGAAQMLVGEHVLEWAAEDAALSSRQKAALAVRAEKAIDRTYRMYPRNIIGLEWKVRLLRLQADGERDPVLRQLLLDESDRLARLSRQWMLDAQ
jgi:hypothetical protein